MPPIKGRLGDRKTVTIELVDRELRIVMKGGFFGGKPENQIIRLDDITSITHCTDVNPFPDAMMIKAEYPDGELVFFSINKEPLEKLALEAEEFLEKRGKIIAEMLEEFTLDREAHVELIFLNLELLDALMWLMTLLQGSVDWGKVQTQYIQVAGVNQDRDNLTHMRPPSLSMDRLAEGVETRSSDLLKSEVYDLVSILYQSCAEKARHQELWFQNQLHRLFMDVSLMLWNKGLEGITGEAYNEDRDRIERRFHELRRLLVEETSNEEIPLLDLSMPVRDAKVMLFEWVEMLQLVDFEPGEELEKRLAA